MDYLPTTFQLSDFPNLNSQSQTTGLGLRTQNTTGQQLKKMWQRLLLSSLKYFSRLCGIPWKSRCGYLSVHCINGWIKARIDLWILQATSGPDITIFQLKSAIVLKYNTCIVLGFFGGFFSNYFQNCFMYLGFVFWSVWMVTSLGIELSQYNLLIPVDSKI